MHWHPIFVHQTTTSGLNGGVTAVMVRIPSNDSSLRICGLIKAPFVSPRGALGTSGVKIVL